MHTLMMIDHSYLFEEETQKPVNYSFGKIDQMFLKQKSPSEVSEEIFYHAADRN